MQKGFYNDYLDIKQNIEDYGDEQDLDLFSFSFMDSINDAFQQNELIQIDLEKYLHGFCDEFSILLNKKYHYPIYASFRNNQLLHAYCKVGDFFIDVRGVTNNQELFNLEFEDDFKTQTILKKFNTYKDFFDYMSKIFNNYEIKNIKELGLLEQDKWFDNYYLI